MKTTEPRKHLNSQMLEIRRSLNKTTFRKSKKLLQLAAKIETAIYLKSLTKKTFAELLKVQPSVVTKWLSGTHNFTVDTLFDIEESLQIELISVNENIQEHTIRMTLIVSDREPAKIKPEPVSGVIDFQNTLQAITYGNSHYSKEPIQTMVPFKIPITNSQKW